MPAQRHKRRIILTNVNTSVFQPRYCKTFLSELVVNALLYDEVLLREGDLVGNHKLTAFLAQEENLSIFSELLSVGAVKILRLGWNSYPENVEHDPSKFPVTARAEEQMRNRSDAGRPAVILSHERKLFQRLDEILIRNPSSHRRQRPFPPQNTFADELLVLLSHREAFHLLERPQFKCITPEMSNAFVDLCSDAHRWERFLIDRKVEQPLGLGKGFYRTQAYQCAAHFGPSAAKAMCRLIESTYAACECERERSDGRYGRSALAELPAKSEHHHEAYEWVTKLETRAVVSKEKPIRLALVHGIGDVISQVRSGEAFEQFQRCVLDMGKAETARVYVDPGTVFAEAWSALCSDYGDAWAKHARVPSGFDKWITELSAWTYTAARVVGYLTVGHMAGLDIAPVVDRGADHRIEYWCPLLSQRARSLVMMPSARAEMFEGATLRGSKIRLYAKRPAE
ncbi:MAG: hypothetical protein JXA57_05080 [Armatimonadetes bacterium]|nr:hypothetical protein [Armatimonadota bacterium]